MRKKLSIILMLCFFPVGLFSCTQPKQIEGDTPTPIKNTTEKITINLLTIEDGNNCNFCINENDVSDRTYVYLDVKNNRCIVSLFYVSLYLGCDIYKQSDNSYAIFYDNDYFILDVEKNTMISNTGKMNIIDDPNPITNPYTEAAKEHIKPYYKRTDTDYFVDSNVLRHFLYLLNYELSIDYDNSLVSIKKISKPTPRIFVDDIELPLDYNVKINFDEHYAEIPLLAILKNMGVKITNHKNNQYLLKKDDKKFVLDTENNTLTKKGTNSNCFSLISGGKIWDYYKATDNEYYVSSQVALPLIIDLGFN